MKKLKLESLEVLSFVTTFNKVNQQRIKSGYKVTRDCNSNVLAEQGSCDQYETFEVKCLSIPNCPSAGTSSGDPNGIKDEELTTNNS